MPEVGLYQRTDTAEKDASSNLNNSSFKQENIDFHCGFCQTMLHIHSVKFKNHKCVHSNSIVNGKPLLIENVLGKNGNDLIRYVYFISKQVITCNSCQKTFPCNSQLSKHQPKCKGNNNSKSETKSMEKSYFSGPYEDINVLPTSYNYDITENRTLSYESTHSPTFHINGKKYYNKSNREEQLHQCLVPTKDTLCNTKCERSSEIHFESNDNVYKETLVDNTNCNREDVQEIDLNQSNHNILKVSKVTIPVNIRSKSYEDSYSNPSFMNTHNNSLKRTKSHTSLDHETILKNLTSENNVLKNRPTCTRPVSNPELGNKTSSAKLDNKIFKCPICAKSFNTKRWFKVHEYRHKNFHQCQLCSRWFSTSELLQKHKCSKSLKNETFNCEICEKRFESQPALNAHLVVHQSKLSKSFSCYICNATFPAKKRLNSHMKNAHQERENPKRPPRNSTAQSFACYTCNATCKFSSRRLLRKHMIQNHAGKWNRPPKSGTVYECEFCQKTFKFSVLLQIHRRRHTGERPFQCSVCPKAFSLKSTLKSHERKHTGERPFQCEQCEKKFSHHAGLYNHRLSHGPIKPFKCGECGEEFRKKTSLTRHSRKHVLDPDYACTFCKKIFADKGWLRKHLKLHDLKPFRCKECSRGFCKEDDLRNHEVYHTQDHPFVCDTCGKGFPVKRQLKSHEKCHTKEKPYECKVCGKQYTWRSSFTNHVKSHKVCKESSTP